tara:strand:+ start:2511 stop:3590 length:1080 start_codon:yes stop_codon:yes gene_type:complete
MTKKIIFSAGGTGGHIFPAINLMKHFSEKGYDVLLVTDKRGDSFINNYSKFKSHIITAGTPTGKNIIKKFLSFFVIFYSILKSIIILRKEKPDLIIGCGGYVSFPISFLSKFFNLPLVIYENNLALGRANKYLLPIAKKILLAKIIKKNFPKKYENKICETGPVLNKEIINCTKFENNNKKESFSIIVLGGSQGAEIFGKIVPPVIQMIKNKGYSIEIIQQCIRNQRDSIIRYYNKNNIKNYVFEFDKNILKLILSSNLAITRCGASTTAELAHTLTPFIAVPLPHSIDSHQHLNAKFYKDEGCCWILEQNNFNTNNLYNLIIETIKNKNKLEVARENMKKNHKNNAYSVIENQIRELI